MNESLYIVIPVYNEAENITQTVEEWYSVVRDHHGNGMSRLLIVNDGSTDDTVSLLDDLMADRPLLHVLNKVNGGHGSAVLAGYRYAVEHNADYVFQTDADRQVPVSEFPEFWRRRVKYDAVIGSRPCRGDGAFRKFAEDVLRMSLIVNFNVSVPDANAPFRLMKASLLEKYLPEIPADYILPNVLLTAFFARYHENICFRKIPFLAREQGKSSINLLSLTRIGFKTFGDFRKFKKTM